MYDALCQIFLLILKSIECSLYIIISIYFQSDFSGRVVNNDHFLYWGDVVKTSDEGIDFHFQVVEQTEFIDDSSFQAFKGILIGINILFYELLINFYFPREFLLPTSCFLRVRYLLNI